MAKHPFVITAAILFLISFARADKLDAASLANQPTLNEYDYDNLELGSTADPVTIEDTGATYSGNVTLHAGINTAAKILINNPIPNAVVRLTNTVSRVFAGTGPKQFTLHQFFNVTDGNSAVTGKDHEIKEHVDNFKPVTWTEEFSPCAASFFQRATHNVSFMSVLKADVNITAHINFTISLMDVSIPQGEPFFVPNMKTQYFSYTPHNNTDYDLKVDLLALKNGTTVSSVFEKLIIGCGGDSAEQSLAGVQVSAYSFTVSGRKGSTAITLVARDNSTTPSFGFAVHQQPNTASDDGWQTWQIVLIVVGAIVVVLAGLVAIGVAVVYLRRSSDYSRIN